MSGRAKAGAAAAVALLLGLAGAWWGWTTYRPERLAREALAADLNDPASAQFQEVRVYKPSGVICGQVNARNLMGGYVGFTEFIVFADTEVRFGPTLAEIRQGRATAEQMRNWGTLFDTTCQDRPT